MTAATEPLLTALVPRLDASDWTGAADALIAIVTNRPHSDVSRRAYRSALRQFLAWHQLHSGGPLDGDLVQRYPVVLEQRKRATSTINQHLSAIRALADECAESGLLDQPTAAAITRVKGPAHDAQEGDQAVRIAQLVQRWPGRPRAISPHFVAQERQQSRSAARSLHQALSESEWSSAPLEALSARVAPKPVRSWAAVT